MIEYDVVITTELAKVDLEHVIRFMCTGYVADGLSTEAREAFKDLGIDLGQLEMEKVPLQEMPEVRT